MSSARFSPVAATALLAVAALCHISPAVDKAQSPASAKPPANGKIQHAGRIRALVFSRDGKYLLTAGEDQTARLWETATSKSVAGPLTHDNLVKAADLSPDGTIVVTACSRTARLWDAATGKPIGDVMRHQNEVNDARFSPDGRYVVTASDDHTVCLWNAATGGPVGPALHHPSMVSRAVFLPDRRSLLTCCSDRNLRKWDIASGKELGTLCTEQLGCSSVSISRDGRMLLTGSRDRGGRLWDLSTGAPLCRPFLQGIQFVDVAFSPDARVFLTGTRQGPNGGSPSVAQLWETASQKKIGEPFNGHCCVAFHPGGKLVATGGDDGTVEICDWRMRLGKPGSRESDTTSSLWDDLADDNASKAYRAIASLCAMPKKAVPMLAARLKPAAPADEKQIRKLIAELDDDAFDVRERAQVELAKLGGAADAILRAARDDNPSPEIRLRLEALLAGSSLMAGLPEQLRLLRAVQVLEEIASPPAERVLRTLSQGAPDAIVTREARNAVERLSSSKP